MSHVCAPPDTQLMESCVRANGTLAAAYVSKFPRFWSPPGLLTLGPLFTACIGFTGPSTVPKSTETSAVAIGSAASSVPSENTAEQIDNAIIFFIVAFPSSN